MTTMILEPPSKTNLGVGLDPHRRAPAGQEAAWKKNIGTKPIPARLALLPEGESRSKRVGISAIVQVGILFFSLITPLIFPQQMDTALKFLNYEVPMPITLVPVAPPPPPPKIVKVNTPPPKPVVEPVLNPKQPHIFVTPKLNQPQPKVHTVETKAPEINPVLQPAMVDSTQPNQPKRPREDVKVGMMSSGNATPATVKAPVEKVQTGGFGDPTGLPGKGNPNGHLIVNAQGLNTLPNGPGYGNGTGGDKGIRGTVASTGFGSGTAVPPQGGGKRGGTVQSGGFADQSTAAAEAPKKKTGNDGPADTAVVVLEKPHPEYTAEGRSLKLEGDVVLDVVFLASGHVQVNRVISGLGHGLDESASRAAQQIKFKPALREGQAVDYPARVRIEFRLAY
jgi:TonB family protein